MEEDWNPGELPQGVTVDPMESFAYESWLAGAGLEPITKLSPRGKKVATGAAVGVGLVAAAAAGNNYHGGNKARLSTASELRDEANMFHQRAAEAHQDHKAHVTQAKALRTRQLSLQGRGHVGDLGRADTYRQNKVAELGRANSAKRSAQVHGLMAASAGKEANNWAHPGVKGHARMTVGRLAVKKADPMFDTRVKSGKGNKLAAKTTVTGKPGMVSRMIHSTNAAKRTDGSLFGTRTKSGKGNQVGAKSSVTGKPGVVSRMIHSATIGKEAAVPTPETAATKPIGITLARPAQPVIRF